MARTGRAFPSHPTISDRAALVGIPQVPGTALAVGAGLVTATGTTIPIVVSGSAGTAGAGLVTASGAGASAIQQGAALTAGAGTGAAIGAAAPSIQSGSTALTGAGSILATGTTTPIVVTGNVLTAGAGLASATGTAISIVITGGATTAGAGASGVTGTPLPIVIAGSIALAGDGLSTATSVTPAPAIQAGSALTAGGGASAATGTTIPIVVSGSTLAAGVGLASAMGVTIPIVVSGSTLAAGAGLVTASGAGASAIQQGSALTAGAGTGIVAGTTVPSIVTGSAATVGAGASVARNVALPRTIATVNNVPAASGLSCQTHIIYAVNSGRWWQFWFDSTATTSLKCASSADLVTWTAGTAGTLALSHASEGRNLCVAYATVAGVDILLCAIDHDVASTGETYYLRATVSGTTVTWGTETLIANGATGLAGYYSFSGCAVAFSSTNVPYVSSGYLGTPAFAGSDCLVGNATAETGSSWTPGAWKDQNGTTVTSTGVTSPLFGGVGATMGLALVPLASGALLSIGGYNASSTLGSFLNLQAAHGSVSGAAYDGNMPGLGFGSPYAGTADWGWAACTPNDVHVVARNPASTAFVHGRFNGTGWIAGDTMPAHTSVGGTSTDTGGIALTTDGTSVWAFLIDSAAGNAIYACQWTSGVGWGTWTQVVGTSATRNFLAAAQTMVGGKTLVSWTEGAASPYTLMAISFPSIIILAHPVVVRQAASRAALY